MTIDELDAKREIYRKEFQRRYDYFTKKQMEAYREFQEHMYNNDAPIDEYYQALLYCTNQFRRNIEELHSDYKEVLKEYQTQ